MSSQAFAAQVGGEMYAALVRVIGSRTVRFTLVVAVPDAAGVEADMFVDVRGNGTPQLTFRMLAHAMERHAIARRDLPPPEGQRGE